MKCRTRDLVWLVLLACAGCGVASTRVAVSGTVSRDGQPVDDARIQFSPAKGVRGPAAGGAIKDGRYRIPADVGPHAGQYTVTVVLGGVPNRKDSFVEPAKKRPNQGQSFQFDREISANNPQIDIELPPQHPDPIGK